jgi:coenzyme F420-0:L-glutamate ligase / coenzyme F420-1:gamma-L-glutamate ligase
MTRERMPAAGGSEHITLSPAIRPPDSVSGTADDAAAFHRLMRSRRSIRNFRAEAISKTVLDRLIASATAAPSAHNRQPWRFVIIEEPPAKAALARAMGGRLAADRRRDGDTAAAIEHDVARSYARLTGAPVLILVNLTLEHADAYPDAARRDAEFLMAVQGTAMAAQNLLLGAHAEGLAACWMCAPLFCPGVVRESLGLPAHWQPQGLIALGIAADAGRERQRRPLHEVAIRSRDLVPSRHSGGASLT